MWVVDSELVEVVSFGQHFLDSVQQGDCFAAIQVLPDCRGEGPLEVVHHFVIVVFELLVQTEKLTRRSEIRQK